MGTALNALDIFEVEMRMLKFVMSSSIYGSVKICSQIPGKESLWCNGLSAGLPGGSI